MTSSLPALGIKGPASGARAVVLLLHGGQATSTAPDRRGLAWARMLSFRHAARAAAKGLSSATPSRHPSPAAGTTSSGPGNSSRSPARSSAGSGVSSVVEPSLRDSVRGRGVAVWLLRYRFRGWNAPAEDPLADARWALGEARRLHPGAPIVLVGHSMGGRVALRLSAEPDVTGVCALAPWIEDGEPWQRARARVLIAHGENDTVTDPRASAVYASRVGATYVKVEGETHALLHRPRYWQRLVTDFIRTELTT